MFGVIACLIFAVHFGQPAVASLFQAMLWSIAAGVSGIAAGTYFPLPSAQRSQLFYRSCVAGGVFLAIVFLGSLLTARITPAPDQAGIRQAVFWQVAFWLAASAALRSLLATLTQMDGFALRIIVYGESDAAAWIRNDHTSRYVIAAPDFAVSACRADALSRAGIWGIVVPCDADPGVAQSDLQSIRSRGIRIFSDRDFLETRLCRLDPARGTHPPLAGSFRQDVYDRLVRAVDLAISLVLLAVAAPVMLAVAVSIRMDDAGPLLFRQGRVGLGDREFTLVKFRSMRVDAERNGPVFAQKQDDRCTRVGRFLRKTHLDELPQFFNVIQGEMSLVGPRPERAHFVQKLSADLPAFLDRSRIKPGVTGWAQVNYPYGDSAEDARAKLSYDLYYIKHQSLALYFLTLVNTVRVMLFQEGSR